MNIELISYYNIVNFLHLIGMAAWFGTALTVSIIWSRKNINDIDMQVPSFLGCPQPALRLGFRLGLTIIHIIVFVGCIALVSIKRWLVSSVSHKNMSGESFQERKSVSDNLST